MKSLIVVLSLICLTGCREKYYRTDTGLLFKIVGTSKDSVAKLGSTAKIHYIQKAGDTIIENNYDKMPLYYPVMPGFGNRYNPLEVFDYGIREGDSIVTIQRVDSMLKKKIFDKLPPFLKMDDEWYTYMKVEKVFRNDSALQADKYNEQQRVDSLQRQLGPARVEDFLKKNKIDFIKSGSGVFIQILDPGQGANIDTGKFVSLKYNFTTLSGKLFDSNIDTSFHKPDTLSFVTGSHFMLKPVEDGLKLLKPGAHAKIYIPAMLAFGGSSPVNKLQPYEDVIFEVSILGVNDKKP